MTVVSWEEMLRRADELARWYVRVGILKSGKGEDRGEDGGPTMIQLGLIQELGLGVPERRWLRDSVRDLREQINKQRAEHVKAVWAGKLSAEKGVKLLGAWLVAEIRRWINAHPLDDEWANAPSTIAAKGSDRPLVDTGAFINSITYEVGRVPLHAL